jgi:hypothetical protein
MAGLRAEIWTRDVQNKKHDRNVSTTTVKIKPFKIQREDILLDNCKFVSLQLRCVTFTCAAIVLAWAAPFRILTFSFVTVSKAGNVHKAGDCIHYVALQP